MHNKNTLISLRNVSVEFDGTRVLDKINLDIGDKEFVTLLGPSGCGKTTTLRIIGGFVEPTEGDVFFDGQKINGLPPHKRHVNTVFLRYALFPHLNVYENVEFGMRIAGLPAKNRKQRAEECLHLVGLSKRMNHRPQELSGGEQQRVAIARAMAHYPKVIFADEPTAALDTAMGLQVVKTFKELIEKEGVTIVMTTHDPSMIEIADTVYTLLDGELVDEYK